MTLTQISTGGVKNDAVTAGKIPANAIGSSEIADDAVDQGAIADEAVDEARLQISNAGTNGQFLQKQSGNTGGLTWAAANEYTHPNHSGEVTSTADGAQVIASDVVDEDNLKISNAGTNGQFLQKQSGNTGGLTWADAGGGVDSDSQGNTLAGTGPGNAFDGTNATSNTLVGKYAGQYITTGDANTIIGYQNAHGVTTGGKNTIIGSGVGQDGSTTTRVYEGNTFIGHNLAQSVTSGSYNIAIGKGAANDLTTGDYNIYIGEGAGYSAAGAGYQIGIGQDALKNCTKYSSGSECIAIGYKSLEDNTTGSSNYAMGYKALSGNTIGSSNIAIGKESNTATGSASNNITIGTWAGKVITGETNILIGTYTGYQATSAQENVGMGYSCLAALTTGDRNTCIGQEAGEDITTGSNNLLLGHDAGKSNSPTGSVTTHSNYGCLGDNNIDTIYSAGSYYVPSDKRDKTDVANFTYGLSWIKKLNPVTYRWDKRTWYHEYDENGNIKTEGTPDGTKKRPKKHIGFLAQDVLEIEQADGFASDKNDMLVVNINADDTAYSVAYEKLVPVLVNAIKELSAKVETLETKVAALEAA